MVTLTETEPAARTAFHPLTVTGVETLTDDSAAVSFAVPAELGELFDFAAGQSLTLRRMIDGVEHRRTYSICSAAGTSPRIGVRVIPDGLFSQWLVHDVRPGDRLLDIGCGWGGLLEYAATRHGVEGVGITLSERQADGARARLARGRLLLLLVLPHRLLRRRPGPGALPLLTARCGLLAVDLPGRALRSRHRLVSMGAISLKREAGGGAQAGLLLRPTSDPPRMRLPTIVALFITRESLYLHAQQK